MGTSVLIVDDHHIFREGLRSLLERQPDIEVLEEASDGRAATAQARRLQPDIVLMDISMPGLNGVEATRQILIENPRTKVLALSMHADGRFVTSMLRAGASGYLLKDCAFEELALAIETLMREKVYISPEVAGVIVDAAVRQEPSRVGDPLRPPLTCRAATAPPLSSREREVLQLLAEGHSTREIAGLLHLAIKTIESHRKQIKDKLRLRSVAALTKYAIREGLTSLDD